MFSFDDVIGDITGTGRYQLLLLCFSMYGAICGAILLTGAVFLAATPETRCLISPFDNKTAFTNLTDDFITQLFIPWNSKLNRYDSCSRKVFDVTTCGVNPTTECLEQIANSTSAQITQCSDGYVYDRSVYQDTIVTEWDLVCTKSIAVALSSFMFYLGLIVGGIIGGVFADRFGRVTMFRIGPVLALCVTFGAAFSPNVYVFSALRFLSAFFYMIGPQVAGFSYIAEICPEKWRTAIGLLYNAVFGAGCMFLSVLSYIWRDWRDLQIASALCFLVIIPFTWLLPKSPRWLCSKGRLDEAKLVCQKIARKNGTSLSRDVWLETEKFYQKGKAESQEKVNTLRETFRRPYTRFTILANMFIWMITSMVYYGLILNTGSLAGDPYINNGIGGFLELAADSLAIPIIFCIGCTKATSYSLFVASGACLISTIALQLGGEITEIQIFATALAMLGRFGSSLAFGVVYLHTVEMFATAGRSTAFGLSTMAARVGSLFSPFTVEFQREIPWLTPTIFGVSALLAAFLTLTFRETKGKELPSSFPEAEYKFRKNLENSFTARLFCLPHKRYDDDEDDEYYEEDSSRSCAKSDMEI